MAAESAIIETEAPRELSDLAMSPEAVIRQTALIQKIMQAVMRDNEHYGVIPGTSGKRSLFKAGAEKLCFTFCLSNRLEIIADNLPGGHREYRIICNLFDRSGTLRGQGVGSASTMESKHRYRGASGKPCPTCGALAIRASKKEYGGGYYCDAKAGGCGWKTKSGTEAAKSLDLVPITKNENPDPADQYNTVLKMAKKRALVDAVLTATAASDIFAQDLEDLEDKIDDFDDAAAAPAPARTGTTAPADAPTDAGQESKPATSPPEPADPPHVTKARAFWNAANTHRKGLGRTLLEGLCTLHKSPSKAPKDLPADRIDQFLKDLETLGKDYDQAEENLAEWIREEGANQ